MSFFVSLVSGAWKYRLAIILSIQFLNKAWKTAQSLTREYIRYRVKQKLKRQILIISIELMFITGAFIWNYNESTLISDLFASVVLWAVTLYNLFDLVFVTIPELRQVYKVLKGKIGFTVKHILKISLVTELMEWNIILLGFSFFLAFSSRTIVASAFSYTRPWMALFESL